jgi:hypothetical protein
MVTTITAAGLGTTSVVKFITNEGPDSVLEGFTITGGAGTFVAGPPALLRGGGIYALNANPSIDRCTVDSNTLAVAATNTGAEGGGIYHDGSTLTLIDCTISRNSAGIPLSICRSARGGGMYSTGMTIAIRCRFLDNRAVAGGVPPPTPEIAYGGGTHSNGTFINCEFRRNSVSAEQAFGGGASRGSAFVHCLFANNSASASGSGFPLSGAPAIEASSATLTNCLAVNNTLAFVQAGVVAVNAASLQNCIVFGNSGIEVIGTASVSYSCIDGGFAGTGNISSNPLFVDAVNQDYHVQSGSPCRDTGDRTLHPADTYDLDGDGNTTETLSRDLDVLRRIVNGQVDMGSYEWHRTCLPDVSPSSPGVAGNGVTDIDDLVTIITSWGDCDQCIGDVNDDGHVNIDDLVLVITGWGGCP